MVYGWEGRPIEDVAKLTVKRDPRRFPMGCATTDGAREVVQWFRNVPEMVQYLLRMEPQRWGVRGAELIDFKARVQEPLTEVDVFGPSDDRMARYNAAAAPAFRLVWWGSFPRLLAADTDWTRHLVDAAGGPLEDADILAERVAAYLRERARGD